ncbi:hypothetical protein ACFP51_27150 [Streptomyces pratens]|uniref:Uncharacterized protein n=1 Tax=Streptomyces pratens TaxID=887456 RepID=A0ABW1M7Y7_9ACTN
MSARAEHAERATRGLRVGRTHGEAATVASAGGTEILRHVHRPGPDAFESRKPHE